MKQGMIGRRIINGNGRGISIGHLIWHFDGTHDRGFAVLCITSKVSKANDPVAFFIFRYLTAGFCNQASNLITGNKREFRSIGVNPLRAMISA